MCGIAGIVDLNGERPIDRGALQRMSDALIHRGPDGADMFIAPGIGFAHRRLAIIDIEGGKQPFHASTGQHFLTFNGEIYNYQRLAHDLSNAGIRLKTRSDTEVIAEGMARHGANYISSLQGMFAFSFWDNKEKTLTIARDRLGEKPLYYAVTSDNILLFASEINAILASDLMSADINTQAIADYLHFGYVPDPKSIYRNIFKLPPAHTLTATRGKNVGGSAITLTPYWSINFKEDSNLTFEQAQEDLINLLDEAVHDQMISDVPLGAFLSGGVDSSAIVASMAKSNSTPVTCSIGFDEASHDERGFARRTAIQFGTNHHEEVASLDVTGSIDEIARVYGEPFADSSALPTWLVSKLARKHVTVALSGDGGDEVFAGYRRYRFFLGEERMRSALPASIRKPIFGTAGALYPKLDFAPRFLRFKTTFQALGEDQASAYARASAIMLPERASALASGDLKASFAGYQSDMMIRTHMDATGSSDPLSRALYTDLKMWLAGRMLVKTDRASMAHSLEVRPPMLDHRLVEWAARLPSSFKLQQGSGKHILKSALETRLPNDLLYRPKQGFGLPVSGWLRAEKNNPLDRLANSTIWKESGLINTKTVSKMVSAHKGNKADHGQELWSILMLDAFLRQQTSR